MTIHEIIDRNYAATVDRGLITLSTSKNEFIQKIMEETHEFIDGSWDELADIVLVAFACADHFGIDLLAEMENKVLFNEIRDVKHFGGLTFTKSGKIYRGDQEVKGTQIGKGHIILTIEGNTMYAARLIYCLFNGLDYWQFKDRIRYIDGNYSNLSLRNLERIERKHHEVRELPAWDVRLMYASGISISDISQRLTVSVSQVKRLLAGYERLTVEEVEAVKRIIDRIPDKIIGK